ncbi:MAG: hypothetical protein WKF40_05105 [Thermoleophilaceae bacterium]
MSMPMRVSSASRVRNAAMRSLWSSGARRLAHLGLVGLSEPAARVQGLAEDPLQAGGHAGHSGLGVAEALGVAERLDRAGRAPSR